MTVARRDGEPGATSRHLGHRAGVLEVRLVLGIRHGAQLLPRLTQPGPKDAAPFLIAEFLFRRDGEDPMRAPSAQVREEGGVSELVGRQLARPPVVDPRGADRAASVELEVEYLGRWTKLAESGCTPRSPDAAVC